MPRSYFTLQSAVLTALSGDVGDVKFSCPSSECVWPKYDSLAICSECRNVTAITHVKCHDFLVTGDDTSLHYPNNTSMDCTYNASLCYYALPGDELGTRGVKFWTLWDIPRS